VTDEELRDAYRLASAGPAGGRGRDGHPEGDSPPHPGGRSLPDPEVILALVEGRGSEEERLATLEAVLKDPELRREFELLRALQVAGKEGGGESSSGGGGGAARQDGWLSPDVSGRSLFRRAAVILVAVGVGSFWLQTRPGPEVVRDAAGGPGLVSPAEALSSTLPVSFTWRSVEGALRYRVEVVTEGGELVASQVLGDTIFTLDSEELLTPLPSAEDYRWWVTAELPGGVEVRSSLRSLRLRAP